MCSAARSSRGFPRARSTSARSASSCPSPTGSWAGSTISRARRGARRASAELGFLDRAGVEQLFDEHRRGAADHGRILYAIAMFSCWWDQQRELARAAPKRRRGRGRAVTPSDFRHPAGPQSRRRASARDRERARAGASRFRADRHRRRIDRRQRRRCGIVRRRADPGHSARPQPRRQCCSERGHPRGAGAADRLPRQRRSLLAGQAGLGRRASSSAARASICSSTASSRCSRPARARPKSSARTRVIDDRELFRTALFTRQLWKATPAITVKREAALKAGLFDETLRRLQDFDFLIRVSEIANCASTDEVLWVKYWDADAISAQDNMIAANVELVRRHPEYLRNAAYRPGLAYALRLSAWRRAEAWRCRRRGARHSQPRRRIRAARGGASGVRSAAAPAGATERLNRSRARDRDARRYKRRSARLPRDRAARDSRRSCRCGPCRIARRPCGRAAAATR